jgi:hypothetical protein
MSDYYMDILDVSRRYFGYSAPSFVRSIFSHLGIAKRLIDASDVRKFAEEIPKATGKFLTLERKEQFKQDVLNIIKSVKN